MQYDHLVQIVDTETLDIKFFVNPHAFNFYKIDCTNTASFDGAVRTMFSSQLKPNPVITLKVLSKDAECARQILKDYPNVICRLIIEADKTENGDATIVFEAVDHLKQFEDYVLSSIGDNDIVREELLNVIK